MIIYEKDTGTIVANLPNDQNYRTFFCHYPQEFVDSLAELDIELHVDINLQQYKVVEGKLIQRDELEIGELQAYGRVLTNEERHLNKLKPTPEEVKKAENTIEILTLIQEVI